MSLEPDLQWSDRLATGRAEIDLEHQELVRLINELAAMHRSGADVPTLRRVFKRLRHYTLYHFRTESTLMRRHQIDASHVQPHLQAHAGFVACLDRAGGLIEQRPDDVVRNLLAFLVQWLVHHITGVDTELTRLLAERTGAASGSSSVRSPEDEAMRNRLVDTVSGLYENIGLRTFELLDLNLRLEHENERRLRIEAALRRSEARFAALYKYAPVALWEFDWSALSGLPRLPATDAQRVEAARSISLLAVNDAGLAQVGCASIEELRGRGLAQTFDGRALPMFGRVLEAFAQGRVSYEGEIGFTRADGERRQLAVNLFVVPGNDVELDQVIAATLDVTDVKDAQERLRYLAMHDSLTDLPNRLLFSDRLRQAMLFGQRTGHSLAIAFIDLDRFKPVNDHHGHAIGDLLLRQVAQRLLAAVRDSDTVARLGGDEFVALLHDVHDGADAHAVVTKLHDALSAPFDIAGMPIELTASIGIALYPDHGEDELTLTRRADQAMYAAKQSGRNAIKGWAPKLDR